MLLRGGFNFAAACIRASRPDSKFTTLSGPPGKILAGFAHLWRLKRGKDWFHKAFRRKLRAQNGAPRHMPATILIADDYEDNRELLRLLLATEHYHVLEAANGRDCLRLAIENGPDLIMIDLSMPVLDGWGVFRELQAHDRTSKIPCIAVTAHADSDRDRAIKNGFKAYLTKPFRTAELLQTVRSLLAENVMGARIASGRSE